jgi:hypothetical protein
MRGLMLLLGLIGFIILIVLLSIGSIGIRDSSYKNGYEQGYKQGQINCINGKISYELQKNDNNESFWIKKENSVMGK